MTQVVFDRRRVNGPEESHIPSFDSKDDEIWSLGQPRNGRGQTDIRLLFLQPRLIDQANGSAYVETQRTKIACAVYGPRQSKNTAYNEKGRLNVEVKFAPFSCDRRKTPMRDAEDRSIGVAIYQALVSSLRLELIPKSSIDVFLTIIEADGLEGCIASGTIAASTALADAGIEMMGLVMSCAASIMGKEIWLDPNEEEARSSTGVLVLSCMPALGTITSVWQSGRMKTDEVLKCMDVCQEKCADIHSVVAQILLEKV
ncbi:ribosomal protein S5 domain 2-type protein [Collybia nuda]|uniref:Ribosomal protein S5 domain 2-type protein n=1 Tax=Collybia nuda TaxID=64659 RepID=A0A9P5Y8P1_9AGAR|nr:ribosomal protein S5 domain 2-type protein [Collybia nuda]